jgi:hypothetical protein
MKKEDRYAELQDKFNALEKYEKDFISWYVIGDIIRQWYDERNKAEKERPNDLRYIEALSNEAHAMTIVQYDLLNRIF